MEYCLHEMKVVKTTVEPPEPLKENEKQIELAVVRVIGVD